MKWLHISDLHYNPKTENFDTKRLLEDLKGYIRDKQISADDVFYTGDFRFAKTQTEETEIADAKNAADQLREIAELAGVRDPERIHIVPGNHDLDRAKKTEDAALFKGIYDQYSRNNGAFPDIINHGGTEINALEYLSGRFAFFEHVARELKNHVWTGDVLRKQIHCLRAYAHFNILYLNTAIASNDDGERGSLVAGYEHIHKALEALEALDERLPTIALGHHGFRCFESKEASRIKALFRDNNIRIYLCGDAHVGDADMADDVLQITAGCLCQSNSDEPVFHVGTIENDEARRVQAYAYLGGTRPGWSINDPLTKVADERIRKIFPQAAGQDIFGRDREICEIAELLKPQRRYAQEVSGVGGIGKTTVCERVLEILENDGIISCVSVSARNSATADVQRDILHALGIDAIKLEISPDKYAGILLEKAKESRRVLYIDNAETPIANDKAAFRAWFYSFARESGWRVMHSTQISIGDDIKHHSMEPLQTGDAYSMFENHWGEIPAEAKEERQAAQRIVTELLSGHPLAIEIAASPRLKRKYSKPSRLEKEIRASDKNLKRDGDPVSPTIP